MSADLPRLVNRLRLACRVVKGERVRREGVGSDFLPTCFLASDQSACTMRLTATGEEHYDQLRLVIALSDASVVGYTAEAYVRTDLAGIDLDEIERIDAAKAFADGDERVSEAIVIYVATPDDSQALICPYRYLPGRRVEWGDEERCGADGCGGIPTAITYGFKLQATRAALMPAASTEDIASWLGVKIIATEVAE